MIDTPRVSIVINNYNYGRFLGDAIESALAQTFQDVEVIVVDDGSTDNSAHVIAAYGNRIVSVIKENGGQGSAYNAGFKSAQGQIVYFLDSDDTLDRDACEAILTLFQDPDVVKVQWPLRVVDINGRWHGQLSTKQQPPDGDLRSRIIEDGPLYDFEFTTGSAYRREFLTQVLPVPEASYRNGADVYLITLAPAFGLLRTSPRPLGTYRAHGRNNFRDRPLDEQRIRNYITRFDTNCSVLERQLVLQGERPCIQHWRERNFNYRWPVRWLQAVSDIEEVVSLGDAYLLVNNNEWDADEPVPGRRAIPFLERDGEYWGPPADDEAAISEFNRLKTEAHVSHIVFSWTAYWWLEQYPRFISLLRSAQRCVVENDAVTVFEIRE